MKNTLKEVRKQLVKAFPERKAVVDGALTALLAGEHMLLLGLPGTAKSLFTRTFSDIFASTYFEMLLTKFSSMEEVFGPVSFKGLKEDRYERLLAGHAAAAEVVFLDEIWKASSSILNSLLTLMQERLFHNNAVPVKTPLKMVIGASNEYPQDDSLAALYDRFSLRFWVEYLADADALGELLERGGIEPVTAKLDAVDLEGLRKQVCDMPFTKANVATLLAIKAAVTDKGYVVSDRTWIKAVKLIKARAVVNGHDKIQSSDYMVLADMLWKEHKERPELRTIIGNAADPYGSRAEAIVDGTKAAMRELPGIDLLKSGQKTKIEMIKVISQVSGKVSAERDKILTVKDEAGDIASINEAVEVVEAALSEVDKLMTEVTRYREVKAV